MRFRRHVLPLLAALVAALAVLASGCGGSEPASAPSGAVAGNVPASAALAPGDALGFVTLVSDEGTAQWQNADRFWRLFPEAHAELLAEIERELAADGLSWKQDVAPALGPELVVVITTDRRPIMLTQPDDAAALTRLLDTSDEDTVTGEVAGWTAIAETAQDLSAYRAAVERGTLADVESFAGAMNALPGDSLLRMWVDLNAVMAEVAPLLEQAGAGASPDLQLDSLGVAVGAEPTGMRFTLGVRLPESASSGTTYEPRLLERVPDDAVAAISFGGSQGAFDKAKQTLKLDDIAAQVEASVGVSFDRLFDALSGEGMVYLRPPAPGADLPEVTIALAPPDAGEAFETVDTLMRKAAEQLDATVATATEGSLDVSRLVVQGVEVAYAKIDDDTVLISTGRTAFADFLAEGEKLGASAAFRRAADEVSLGTSTQGFAYVDLDGLIPLIEGVAGPETLPGDARAVLSELDSLILQGSTRDELTQMSGFLRTVR